MRKNADRFNGVTEKELYDKTLADIIDFNLDIIFVNINPGLYSVYKQHHYSGPGNHFWRCLFESGLTNRVLKSTEDYKLLDYKIGLLNMIEKPNIKTCQDMSLDEIKEAQQNLIRKVRLYKPKVIAFNGKSIFEVYTGQSVDKEFNFGKQPFRFDSNQSDTILYALPSSSARCSQLPKVIDKVPFYAALKKLKDYLNGLVPYLNDDDIMFPDFKVALDSRNIPTSNDQTTSNLNGTVNHNDSDLGVDEEDVDDDDPNNDEETETAKNVHRIKFVRLNNLPYSQIPSYILDDLKKQRQLKKGVTITTTKDYFNIKKNSKSITSSTGPGSCSDLDTQSTATSDSDYGTASSSNLDSASEQSSTNSSKISSIIFNVYSSNNKTSGNNNNNNSTSNNYSNNNNNNNHSSVQSSQIQSSSSHIKPVLINKIVSHIKPALSTTPENHNRKINVILASNNMNHSSQSPQQTQKVLIPVINSNINGNQGQIYQLPKQVFLVQTQQQQQQQQNQLISSQNKNVECSNLTKQLNQTKPSPIVSQAQTASSGPVQAPVQAPIQVQQPVQNQLNTLNENNLINDGSLIEFELIKKDAYKLDDYYVYENVNTTTTTTSLTNHANNPYYCLTDEYFNNIKNDLSKTIKLHFDSLEDDEGYSLYSMNNNNKRAFKNVNDASSYVLSSCLYNNNYSNQSKRQCLIDINKL